MSETQCPNALDRPILVFLEGYIDHWVLIHHLVLSILVTQEILAKYPVEAPMLALCEYESEHKTGDFGEVLTFT